MLNMTAFFMPCLKKIKKFLAFTLLLGWAGVSIAEGIVVQSVSLEQKESTYFLDATFNIDLNSIVRDALNKGVALPFVLDFHVIRQRWNIWDQKIVETSLPYRLSYSALTRQYQIRDELRGRDSNYETLEQALKSAGDIRGLAVFNAEQLKPGLEYEGQVRLRLEVGGLPSALQLEALESDKWEVSSQWYRWIMAK